MKDERVQSLKGFLILCVVLGHLSTDSFFSDSQRALRMTWEYSVKLIPVYYFHVPLFFAVSILFVKAFDLKLLQKRAVQILVPYALFLITRQIIVEPDVFLRKLCMGNFYYIQRVLWFLPALFSCNILFSVYRYFQAQKHFNFKGYTFSVAGIAGFLLWGIFMMFLPQITAYHVNGSIPFGIDIAVYLFPYFLFILFLYEKKDMFKNVSPFLWLTGVIAFILLITWFEPVKTNTAYHHRIDFAQLSVPGTLQGYAMMLGLSGSIFMFFLSLKPWKPMAYLGNYTLPVFLLHMYIIGWMLSVPWMASDLFTHGNGGINYLYGIFVLCCAIGVPVLVSKALMRISRHFKLAGFVA